MKSIRTQDAVGHALIHDLVRIVIGEVKDTPIPSWSCDYGRGYSKIIRPW